MQRRTAVAAHTPNNRAAVSHKAIGSSKKPVNSAGASRPTNMPPAAPPAVSVR